MPIRTSPLLKALQPFSLPIMEASHARFTRAFIDRYLARRLGSRRHEQVSVDQSLKAIEAFLHFAKKPPWAVGDDDWDRWCMDMAQRGLARSTVRSYQSAVAGFFEFCARSSLNAELQHALKCRVTPFVSNDMLVRHSDDRRDGFERPCVRPHHLDAYLASLDRLAEEHTRAKRFVHAALVRRDRVLSMVLFRFGLRISEALGIDVDDFQHNPDAPRYGRFGYVTVLGKGHHASDKIPREVPTLHSDTPSMLAEYLKRTRPLLLGTEDTNAFFLSSRGTRLSAEDFRGRFRTYWKAIGLGAQAYTPHSLRHGSITAQLSKRRPLVFVSKFHGHLHTSTTDRYSHFSSEYMREQVRRIIADQLKRVEEPTREPHA